jgi:diguanylate cyclase (GGDEF)-like protein
VDHLKKVNDSLGHQAGDAVLRGVAQAFSRRFRDRCCRFGGHQFLEISSVAGGRKLGFFQESILADVAVLSLEGLSATEGED